MQRVQMDTTGTGQPITNYWYTPATHTFIRHGSTLCNAHVTTNPLAHAGFPHDHTIVNPTLHLDANRPAIPYSHLAGHAANAHPIGYTLRDRGA